jgi:hypothetical protein
MSNEIILRKKIRASLKFGDTVFTLICGGIDFCKIKTEHLIFNGCENLEIVDEDGTFMAETFSCKKEYLIDYAVGSYAEEEEEPAEEEPAEEEPAEEEPAEEEPAEEEPAEEEPLRKDIGSFING